MNRIIRNKNLLLCGIFPNLSVEGIDFEKYKEARGLFIEDPRERVKSIFSRDEMGALHPELQHIINATQIGLFVGAAYGGTLESMKKTEKFIRTNDTNVYVNKGEMYKVLAHENIRGIIKGIFLWGPKFAFFCGGFTLITSCCEAYRNKSSILDTTLAGLTVGGMCKFSFGPRGMLSGAIIGGILGTLFGTFQWIRYKLTNMDNVEIKYAQFAFVRYREQLRKGIIKGESEAQAKGFSDVTELDNFEVKEDRTVKIEQNEAEKQNKNKQLS